MPCYRYRGQTTVRSKGRRLSYYVSPASQRIEFTCLKPLPGVAESPATLLSPQEFRYARMILLLALVAVGFGFTVLFAILGPLGREVGMSELQISSIIAASSLVVFLASPRWGRLSDRWGDASA